jgi:serine/threonine-protein phosphatase CPPED1
MMTEPTTSSTSEASDDVFFRMQQNRTHHHPNFYQTSSLSSSSSSFQNNHQDETTTNKTETKKKHHHNVDDTNEASLFTFIVMADTQFGMLKNDESWDIEMKNCQYAIEQINAMNPRPLFCCVCGDLINMTHSVYTGRKKPQWALQTNNSNTNNNTSEYWTENECDDIQSKQYQDFKRIWSHLHTDIPLVCICGNHDVGNRPTIRSIQQYTNQFGSDYLSFYANPISFFIVLNSSLFNDNSASMQQYNDQLVWLQEQLHNARVNHTTTKYIFILAHHPLFLYDPDEEYNDLIDGISVCGEDRVSDGYFPLPKPQRQILLDLFEQYNVTAYFAGHFHQNMIAKTKFNMEMIITGSVSSVVLQTTGKAKFHTEPKTLGYRIVSVDPDTYHHTFVSLEQA